MCLLTLVMEHLSFLVIRSSSSSEDLPKSSALCRVSFFFFFFLSIFVIGKYDGCEKLNFFW